MPIVDIEGKYITVISTIDKKNEVDFQNPDLKRIDEDKIIVKFGPICFKSLLGINDDGGEITGDIILKTNSFNLIYPCSFFKRQNDNDITLLRRVYLFFSGLVSVFCNHTIPIYCQINKKNLSQGIGCNQITNIWQFIPTDEFWGDLEKELKNVFIKMTSSQNESI